MRLAGAPQLVGSNCSRRLESSLLQVGKIVDGKLGIVVIVRREVGLWLERCDGAVGPDADEPVRQGQRWDATTCQPSLGPRKVW